MDQNDLGLARYDAGAEYLKSLNRLDLSPEALFWAYDKAIEQFVLVLVTRFFDYAGPLAVTEALFKAYRASATPAEIDPFIIRVHSPEQRIYKELLFALRSTGTIAAGWTREDYHRAVLAGEVEQAGVFAFTYADLSGFGAWIYKASEGPRKLIDVAKPWTRFSSKVQRLAA